jgi:hypothetical protein
MSSKFHAAGGKTSGKSSRNRFNQIPVSSSEAKVGNTKKSNSQK